MLASAKREGLLSSSLDTVARSGMDLPANLSFVVLANATWDSSSRINCHHIADRVSKDHKVLFVESIGARSPSLRSARDLRKVWRRVLSGSRGLHRYSSSLAVLSPMAAPGFGNRHIDSLNGVLLGGQIGWGISEWLRTPQYVLWVFTPAFEPAVSRLKPALRVYQCVDEHSAYPGARSAHITALEENLLRDSDVVLATSLALFESRRRSRADIVCMPNVADVELFSNALNPAISIPDEIRGFRRPIIGFVGNISAFKVDCNLLSRVAVANPQFTFLLIGDVGLGESVTLLESLKAIPNVHFLGPRAYSDLPAYLKGIDVCMIPFAFNRVTEKSLPMKLFEYMATGKPIVATATEPLREYSECCYLASNAEEFSAGLVRALEEPVLGERAQVRLQVARHHGWDARMVEIGEVLKRALDTRASRPQS